MGWPILVRRCGDTDEVMLRWTARFLLVLSLVGIIAPAALAMTTPPPHACCLRKGMHCHNPAETQVQTPGCCNHDCCRSLTVPQFAEYSPAISNIVAQAAVSLTVELVPGRPGAEMDASYSGRAPPVSFQS
jgi:hypothetical protein